MKVRNALLGIKLIIKKKKEFGKQVTHAFVLFLWPPTIVLSGPGTALCLEFQPVLLTAKKHSLGNAFLIL